MYFRSVVVFLILLLFSIFVTAITIYCNWIDGIVSFLTLNLNSVASLTNLWQFPILQIDKNLGAETKNTTFIIHFSIAQLFLCHNVMYCYRQVAEKNFCLRYFMCVKCINQYVRASASVEHEFMVTRVTIRIMLKSFPFLFRSLF